MTFDFMLCILGFGMLYFGAEWLVRGSASLARSLDIQPIIIGLTVVAFGTSAPELVVSLDSSIKARSMIAIGNVIGSNICNIGLIMGLTALLQPITSHRAVVKGDIPIMLGISFFLFFLLLDSRIGRLEGIVLFTGIILYTFMNYYLGKKESERNTGSSIISSSTDLGEIVYVSARGKQILLIFTGLAAILIGADLVVDSAIEIMQVLEVNEKFVGLTIVALGTSLPELATSGVAAVRKEMDISIGNLVGSNVFNILSVLGAASIVRPILIPGGFVQSSLIVDYSVMMFTGFLPLLLMYKTSVLSRKGGFLLLISYGLYLTYLINKG